jgi:hypothetical protein
MSKGVTVKDVNAHEFVVMYAAHLKKQGKIDKPELWELMKTGTFKELAPYNEDWYYIRCGDCPDQAPQRSRWGGEAEYAVCHCTRVLAIQLGAGRKCGRLESVPLAEGACCTRACSSIGWGKATGSCRVRVGSTSIAVDRSHIRARLGSGSISRGPLCAW